ncbi:HNH endonuclease [Gemmatimonas sp. UBA7669]|uniref:HNH endonuclease n=1 Tax=Gemmatimonas sp. UBA7669 TaxID=1946568 RepID=UPI0025C3C41B|nr:HNH endonuclease [Gemmatimonas sp. UBA7669]
MRPVRRGASPQNHDFDNYRDAFPQLVGRLGSFCSFCERRIATNLAVEHIQPKKGPFAHPTLVGRWENFLLACVNCNSTKGDKDVGLAAFLLPDRDNTFVAFSYAEDGAIRVDGGLSTVATAQARATLSLVGLDKRIAQTFDENGKLVAIDRVSQRMQAWLLALTSKEDLDEEPQCAPLRRQIVRTAVESGFFSIWMTVFAQDADMRGRLIDAFDGTRGSGCFDATNVPVRPAPNPDALAHGGKA